MQDYEALILELNDKNRETRLSAVKDLAAMVKTGEIKIPKPMGDTNNHIHTKYSFSPYSPSKAVWCAYAAGLETAGIIDHDSVAGVNEFILAAQILNMPVSGGFEVRCDLSDTEFASTKLNNPDQSGNAYITVHGLPHDKLNYINDVLAPYRAARLERTKKMAEGIAKLLSPYGIEYKFERDVLPLTLFAQGGTITERYLLYALANILIEKLGCGEDLVSYLENELSVSVSDKAKTMLNDEENPYYIYDLLGLLKAEFLDKVYIPGGADCPKLSVLLSLAEETGVIIAYCYLGDQGLSVTGDKRAAKYEDDDLENILATFKKLGVNACAYSPSRNTDQQIKRLKELCAVYDLFEICGEDINQPRQQFICEKMRNPLYADAYDCTYALIGHEITVTKHGKDSGLFADLSTPLPERIQKFKQIALNAYGK